MIIIGITGTLGAGKGTVVDYLKNHYNFSHYSARDFIVAEIQQRTMPVNRDTMTEVANDLRHTHHPGYIIEKLYEQTAVKGTNAVIESVRTPAEIAFLQQEPHFKLFAVDAPAEVRYERIVARKSSTDAVSFEKFLEDEKREMDSINPHKQNLRQCISAADHVFRNDGKIEELYAQVDAVMKSILI